MTSYGADESTVSGGSAVQGSILNNTFARSANLRGLGTTATLVLIDGHRVAPGGQSGQLVDLDAIPQAAIGGVEVVADGASALYGSDAVAGVINFVLRRNFDGLEATARYGIADGTDQYVLSAAGGRKWDTGSVFVAYEYQRRNALAASERSNLYNDDLRPYGGSAPPALASPGNVLIGGVAYPVPAGQNATGVTLGSLGTRGQPNLQSVWEGQEILPDQARHSVIGTFNQELGGGVEFFADGLYTHREFSIAIAAANSGAAGFAVPFTNSFSPCAPGRSTANTQGITCPANGTVNVQYSLIDDIGNQVRAGFSELWSARGGLNVELGRWKATVAASTSRNREYVATTGNISATAVAAAIAGQANYNNGGVAGTLVRPASVPAFNPFCGGVSCNTAATTGFIGQLGEAPADYRYTNVSISGDGPLFDLPGGAVRVALGGEYRHDTLENINRTTVFASSALNTLNLSGAARDVWGAYGELYVPLFGASNAMGGLQKLELSLAGRVEDYSDFGTTVNPKVGITWVPVTGIRVRGSYGRSFRAPTLSDIDPASTGVLRAIALTAAQATAAGLPAVSTLSGILTQGGSQGIDPERATTWSLGLDITPPTVPGLTVSANYYRLTYTNRIDSPGLNAGVPAVLAQRGLFAPVLELNPTYYPTSTLSQAQFNARVAAITGSTRPVFSGVPPQAANVAAIVTGNRDNTGTLKTSGIDLNARYDHATGWGTVRGGVIGTYVFNYKYSILPGAPEVDYVNEFNTIGSPLRFRARGEIGADVGGFSGTAFVNFQNAYRFPRALLPAGAPSQYERVKAYTTFDATLSYDTGAGGGLLGGLRLTLTAQNLFDRDPPLVINGGGSPILFDPTNASALGRLVSVQVTKKW